VPRAQNHCDRARSASLAVLLAASLSGLIPTLGCVERASSKKKSAKQKRAILGQTTRRPTPKPSPPATRPQARPAQRAVPPYATPANYTERLVQVGRTPWLLPGTLSWPKPSVAGKVAPLAALVLVHGSGPHDRDETVGPNKPFRDIATALASRGIVVLRYDKRSKAHREAMRHAQAELTSKEETIDDALAAIASLRRSAGIDARRIFVLGHSLGGHLLPRIARADGKLAGLIFMAANSRPFEQVLRAQFHFLAGLDGKVNEHEAKRRAKLEAKIARLARLKPDTPRGLLPLGLSAAFWLDLKASAPLQLVRKLRLPMLFLQGERDYQVTDKDLAGWRRALAGRKNVRFRRYPRANHLLLDNPGKPHPREFQRPGFVTKQAIVDIAKFIKTAK
jgi:dienelactone hydrolase